MVLLYWNVGKVIKGNFVNNKRAEYGKEVLKKLGKALQLSMGMVSVKEIFQEWYSFCG